MFYANTLKPGTRNNYGHFLLIAAVCSLDFVTHKGFQTTFYLSISCCDLFKFVMFNSAFMPHVAFPSLLEGHQTCSVKSKSVSDVDFPDQSECTNTAIASLLDLTSMCLLRRQVSETLH